MLLSSQFTSNYFSISQVEQNFDDFAAYFAGAALLLRVCVPTAAGDGRVCVSCWSCLAFSVPAHSRGSARGMAGVDVRHMRV